jgi:hypothetical protein
VTLKIGQKVMTIVTGIGGLETEVIQPVVGTTGTYVLKGKNENHPSVPIYVCIKESEVIPDDTPNFAKAQEALARAKLCLEEWEQWSKEFTLCFPQRQPRVKKAAPAPPDPNAPK